MNDASESSFVTCVKIADIYCERLLKADASRTGIQPLTPADRAKLLANGSIISIAPPMLSSQVTTLVKGKCEGEPGTGHPDNIAAFQEIMALGDSIVRGDITNISRKHRAHVGTVQKMVHNAKGCPPRACKEKSA